MAHFSHTPRGDQGALERLARPHVPRARGGGELTSN
jgi:hypothetical protein